ncbi:hypothetical protein RM533_13465 [Croceicoccus sp. F390]|uniref:Uncharacterized protein n=1 Tax=Croceicoccus esteveae TaxID=3075597 RepID=A0ABU2ZLC7_9SPHN|nr:hypothetical protein [Croceicoccus sp. F390]MDT0577171.1 hypothetical protein [Croceicoccus sp. F390]
MTEWQTDLAGCFDNLDRLFAYHAMDEDRAFALLAKLRAQGIGWRTLSDAIRALLDGDGCSVQHVELQMQQVEQRFRPWLGD